MFYHTLCLQRTLGVTGGYRSICVDKINVDEDNVKISRGTMSMEGVPQLQKLDISKFQPASQASATSRIVYEETEAPGEVVVHANSPGQCFKISGIMTPDSPEILTVKVKGKGKIALHAEKPDGPILSTIEFDTSEWCDFNSKVKPEIADANDICFTFEDGDFLFKEWKII